MERDGSLEKLIADAVSGDGIALRQLLIRAYDEIRRVAHYWMSGQSPGHTLQTTAVMHEAFARVLNGKSPLWQGEKHFLNSMAMTVRRVLRDHARSKRAGKRLPPDKRVPFESGMVAVDDGILEKLAIEEALTKLEESYASSAKVFELRHFGGMTIEEVAVLLDLSAGKVSREWKFAKAWMERHL